MFIPIWVFVILTFLSFITISFIVFQIVVFIGHKIWYIRETHSLVYKNVKTLEVLERRIDAVANTDYDEIQNIKDEIRKLRSKK